MSDGGHIENLGLYPLLQRRCRLIIAIDGERNPPDLERRQKFSGLATAIRYARIDLQIDVDIDLEKVGADGGCHFAVGAIKYGDGFPDGRLIYIKASLTGDENTYVREYSLDRPAFPHKDSTGDQFFDEERFECYRALGYHATQDFLGRTEKGKTAPPKIEGQSMSPARPGTVFIKGLKSA